MVPIGHKFVFHYLDRIMSLVFKRLAIFCDCTGWFVSDLARNQEDRFYLDEANIPSLSRLLIILSRVGVIFLNFRQMGQGPVVQSIVSLTTLLRRQLVEYMLT